MYLKYFPNFTYQLNNREYTFLDIFRRVAFSTKSLNNNSLFYTHYITEVDNLENLAFRYYGDPKLSWLILLVNNISGPIEFPQSEDYLNTIASERFSGKSFFFYEYLPMIKAGDVLVQTDDSSKYAVVKEYDAKLRYIWTKNTNITTAGNSYYIKRLIGDTVNDINFEIIAIYPDIEVTDTCFLRRIINNIDTPIDFYQSTNKNYISPYFINSTTEASSKTIGIFSGTQDQNFSIYNTLLGNYMRNNLNSSYFVKTKLQQFIEDNNKNRIIKILKKEYLSPVVTAIRELLVTNTNRKLEIEIP